MNEQRAKSYNISAHIQKIGFKAKGMSELMPATLDEHFLLFHSEYVHPSHVLHAENITLMGVSKDAAFFAVVPSEIDVHDSNLYPFMYLAQFKYATHLIVMPMTSFHRLAAEIGEPKAQVVLLSNTGRCGSTAMVQVFHQIPNTLVMSEPDAFLLALQMYSKGKTTDEEDEMILKSITRLQCNNKRSRDVSMIIIKTRSMCVQQIKKINSSCKFVQHVFMYRNPKENLLSIVSAFGKFLSYLPKKFFLEMIPLPETRKFSSVHKEDLIDGLSGYGCVALMWALTYTCFLEYRKEGVEICPIRYEDLLSTPRDTVSRVFSVLGISQDYVSQALTALQKDSQRGSVLARDNLKKNKKPTFSEKELEELDTVLRKYGFSTSNTLE